ncbi:5-formyltetrahydrofolate cyclo-ligase [Microlunatus parietis]|uniref:5-formyltetrahydrofolate cyclo-ligase n=1 Tax=Microlunatus parietis TaxID=682979 RepID=A0A7Y9I5E1_9ACTN|nr:5-formyltetrahydrofolate cyclo-ligase [Microlunatus parietis]NYE70608.1 5-formyltetrahydrofolate cyclo-ligase [Microlunatus parietis]
MPQAGDVEALNGAKAVLRNAVLLRRDTRSDEERRANDEARFGLIQRTLLDRGPLDKLACYLSSDTEPGTLQLVAWLAAQGVEVLLPVLTDGDGGLLPGPAWAWYTGPDALRTGRKSILEPTGEVLGPEAVREAEVIICPALAADPAGQRLGRGAGWYDQALAELPDDAEVWTLINDDELLNELPAQEWDRPVRRIITQTRVIDC